jgi:stage II sporulation protein D
MNILKNFLFFSVLFLGNFVFAEEVRIGILAKYKLTSLELDIEDGRIFYSGKDKKLDYGQWKVEILNDKLRFTKDKVVFSGDHFLINSKKPFTVSLHPSNQEIKRNYKGSLELYSKNGKIILVLTLALEDYVSSSTNSELGELLYNNKSLTELTRSELIATQEIVIRTYILKEKRRHSNESYDFCDLTHCIHFMGNQNNHSLYPGEILSGDEDVNGYFHSTCGGNLSGPEVFWSKHEYSKHYKRGRDPNCEKSPHSEWETILYSSDLEKILGEKRILSIQTIKKNGRVQFIKYTNENQVNQIISISSFFSKSGKLFGWNKIKSNDFMIERIGDSYKFKGHGLGHGIGLCQWGAANLAANGKSHEEILDFYFPKAKLIKNR